MSSLSQNKQAVNSVNKNNLEDLGFAAVKCCDCDDRAMFLSYTEELHWRFCCQEESHGNGRHFYSIPLSDLNTALGAFHWISHLETTKSWFPVSRQSWNELINQLLGRHSYAVSPTYPFEEVFCADCDSFATFILYSIDRASWYFACSEHAYEIWNGDLGCRVNINVLKDARQCLELLRHLEQNKEWFPSSRDSWKSCVSELLGASDSNFENVKITLASDLENEWRLKQIKAERNIVRRVAAMSAAQSTQPEN